MVNEKYNVLMFEEFKLRKNRGLNIASRDIRKMIEKGALPALPASKVDGLPMCLPWHVKGMCNGACPRAAIDHVEYSAAELQDLQVWCAAHYPEAT